MKKCTFYRTVYNPKKMQVEAVKTEGFFDVVADNEGNEITLCFHKEFDYHWICTEKSTGLRVSEGSKRKDALEEAQKRLGLIYVKIIENEKYKELISKAYAGGLEDES